MGEGKRSRRARASAIATAVAITAPILFLGGAIARGAESSSVEPTSVSVSYTDGPTTTTTTDPGNTLPSTVRDVNGPISRTAGNSGTTGNTGYGTQSAEQMLVLEIQPGALSITPATESISFTPAHGNGNNGRMVGSLSTVTVVDARGSLVGWTATVSLQSVDGLSAADLANAKLCVKPDAPTVVAGNPPEVKAGRNACGRAGDALTLLYAPPNGGGGTFSDTGNLTLSLPGAPVAGPVTATLAVTVH